MPKKHAGKKNWESNSFPKYHGSKCEHLNIHCETLLA